MRRPCHTLLLGGWATLLLATGATDTVSAAQSPCLGCRLGSTPVAAQTDAAEALTLEAVYTFDVISNVDGGIDTGTDVLGDLSVTLSIDAEALLGLTGGTLFFYGLVDHGGEPSERIGDIQVADNIEAADTWRLYEAWYQQNLPGTASLLFGLYDLNSEFDVIESAGLFINSSFGIGAEYAASGRNGPSIFPVTSLGTRLALRPTPWLSGKLAVLDGVPGDPDDPYGTHVELGDGDGVLVAAELVLWTDGHETALPHRPRVGRGRERPPYRGKLALGAWKYTGDLPDPTALDGGGRPRHGGPGVYGLFEYRLTDGPVDRGPMLFLRAGWADPDVNRLVSYTGGGIVFRGLLRPPEGDRIGIGVAAAHNSSRYQRERERAGAPVDDMEVAIELTYAVDVASWLALQPDLQYIVNPGMERGRDNAWVLGLRSRLSY